ncbi:MAG TPA: ABC transporter substrate-binding protein [Beijerinckiaceae bacterium]|jgi:peptide/nickel transport system substrate-binding protein
MSHRILAFAAALFLATAPAEARSLRWAAMGDALTLDPHAAGDRASRALVRQVYDTLLTRGPKGELLPELAASWRTLSLDASTWEFRLRPGVKFHNGAALTADDVAFSIQRAMGPASELRGLLASIDRVTRVDELTVRVRTKGANPRLPDALAGVFVVSRAWAEANAAALPQDPTAGEGFATRSANGTGPFALVSREPGRTVLRRNEQYWSRDPGAPFEVTEVTHAPVRSGAARIAALLAGEADIADDVPAQDVERLRSLRSSSVATAVRAGTIYLGLDVAAPELAGSTVKGRNPFADRRVRQALNLAVDRIALREALRGQAEPAGALVPPGPGGPPREVGEPPKADPAKAKALLAEAGFTEGFGLTLSCPGDAAADAEAVCREVAGMLTRAGVAVTVVVQPKAQALAAARKSPPEAGFILAVLDGPLLGSEAVFATLVHTREGRYGALNAARYSNPDLDRRIEAIAAMTDPAKRAAAVAEVWKAVQDEVLFVPLVHPAAAVAARGFEVPLDPDGLPRLKGVSVKGP